MNRAWRGIQRMVMVVVLCEILDVHGGEGTHRRVSTAAGPTPV
jgi:hypothetical protein